MSTISYEALALWAQVTEKVEEGNWSSLFAPNSPLAGVKEVTMRNFQKIFEKLKRHNIGLEFFECFDVNDKKVLSLVAQRLMIFLQQRNLWAPKWGIETAECLFLFFQYKGQLGRVKARVRKTKKKFLHFSVHILGLTFLLSRKSDLSFAVDIFRNVLTKEELAKLKDSLGGRRVELTPTLGAIFYRLNKRLKKVPEEMLALGGELLMTSAANDLGRDIIQPVRGDPVGKTSIPDLEIDWDVGTMVTVLLTLATGLLVLDRTTYVAGVAWWYTILGGLLFGIFYFIAFPPLVFVSEKRRMNRGR